jgi:PAS domain S-box-containing protein
MSDRAESKESAASIGLEASQPGPQKTTAVLPERAKSSSKGVDIFQSENDVVGRTTGEGGPRERRADEAGALEKSPSDMSDSHLQLNQYRERLARDLERREHSGRGLVSNPVNKSRVSPIQEEATTSGPMTTSTESNQTVRGGVTPGFSPAVAGTPSYPFPRMVTPSHIPSSLHRPFTTLSPTGVPRGSHSVSFEGFGAQDKVLSGSSTPASNRTFLPSGEASHSANAAFPSPNLYDLSLMLTAEPGLEAWWNTVVQIMTDVYKAERVTLAVPADSTDLENVPWGQKATYNEHREDDLSMGYMAKNSSMVLGSNAGASEAPSVPDEQPRPTLSSRPSLQSRHSFTTYEENKERTAAERVPSEMRRPAELSRSKSYLPPNEAARTSGWGDLIHQSHPGLYKAALEKHDAVEDQRNIPSWEAPLFPQSEGQGRVLPVLQALDYEADSLIDHGGVTRVLERGKVIALTRTYPYLQSLPIDPTTKSKPAGIGQSSEGPKKKTKKRRSESMSSKLSSLLGHANANATHGQDRKAPSTEKARQPTRMMSRTEDESPRPPTPKYEEYEQPPPSPWSQSPAPSPAVRPDPTENPFFTDAMVDEESFNPETTAPDYTSMPPPEAIGVDNSWTVLHIPLTHVLLSKTMHPFKLDAAAMEQKSHSRSHSGAGQNVPGAEPLPPESSRKNKPAPIAILSVLSPMIPYPSNLRHSLEHLAPHLATSFSLARHYTSLETELAGLRRRRPPTTGFGAIATDGRPLEDPMGIGNLTFLPAEDIVLQRSLTGSITSPSDYSGFSKSAAGSPGGTPGWEQSALSILINNRQSTSSPGQIAGDSYFSTKQRSGLSRTETAPGSVQRVRRSSKDNSPVDKRPARTSGGQPQLQETAEMDMGGDATVRSSDETIPSIPAQRRMTFKNPPRDPKDESTGERAVQHPLTDVLSKSTEQINQGQGQQRHTQLHSYGGDFATSFQSLPPSSSIASKPAVFTTAASRSSSISVGPVDMPPPSDRLKGLILDSLPAHVFVALPQHGEIVWVNSRYLTYRGQAVADLAADPWGSIHPDDRDEYLKAWGHSLRTGEQFSRTVRIRRFDGAYRWFYARAVASRDKRGVIMQFLGSYMDIHDQHIAELKAARQEEIEASEAKHRLLANLIPQIIFTATEDEGITFANEQWLSYTGQSFEDSLGLGFMDFVHPEDLAKCQIPTDRPPTPLPPKKEPGKAAYQDSASSSESRSSATLHDPNPPKQPSSAESNLRGIHLALSRNNSSSSESVYELATADLTALAKKGIVKVATDSNGRLSYTTEVRLRAKSGEYRWHLIRCVEIDNINFGNGASSYFGSATDINDHKLLEAKLKEAMESTSRFLSNMSHEIRTPLIGISGMVTFLQDTTLNEEQRDYTNTIQTSAKSLLMIINDILDLSKVDAGMMKLKYEWFHTRSLIEDVNELVSTMAVAKRLELNYVVEEAVPAWVKGDKVRIRQVLLNVIGNAIKFTTEGEVFSLCKVYAGETPGLEDHEIMLEFAIIDTGRGFTKDEAELIFKPFSQIDGSSTRQHGGSGLGLVISKQLVELHGGNMQGTAIPGKGSTFSFTAKFTLPTEEDHPEPPLNSRELASRRGSAEVVGVEAVFKPLPAARADRTSSRASPVTDAEFTSPALASSGSSNPSVRSIRSQFTDASSVSSVNVGLVSFSQAARASGQDLSQMKLEMPSGRSSPGVTPTLGDPQPPPLAKDFRPPMYSILIICPQTYSREATRQHIEMTLPKDVPYQITAKASVEEAQRMIGGDDAVTFTHIVINLPTPDEVIGMIDQVTKSATVSNTTILILSDSVQRQAVMKLAGGTKYEQLLSENQVMFIYKPVKPSRFAVIFDPEKVRDLSIDRNRSSAQRMVESQKASYLEIEKRMGNKGYRVLLVEDNPVNQKVLRKYLKKVGVEVEVAADGVECTEMVFSQPHDHWSLILVSLSLVSIL